MFPLYCLHLPIKEAGTNPNSQEGSTAGLDGATGGTAEEETRFPAGADSFGCLSTETTAQGGARSLTEDKSMEEILKYIEGEKEEPKKKKKTKKKKVNNQDKSPERRVSSNLESDIGDEREDVGEHGDEEITAAAAAEPDTFLDHEDVEGEQDDSSFTVFTKKRKPKVTQNEPKTFFIKTTKVHEPVQTKKHYKAPPKYIGTNAAQSSNDSSHIPPNSKPNPKIKQESNLLLAKSDKEYVSTSKDHMLEKSRSQRPEKIQTDNKTKIERRLSQVREENNKNEASAQVLMTESRFMLVDFYRKVEKCEDSIYSNEKMCMQIDADLEELEIQRREMEERKATLLKNNVKLEVEKEKHRQDRINLEDDLERKMAVLKVKKNRFISEIKSLKEQLSDNNKDVKKVVDNKDNTGTITTKDCEKSKKEEEQSFPLEFMQAQILQMKLDLLEEQIKKKESDLECPVCLETAQIPIYMCNEQHIICQHCLEKVTFS